MATLKKRSTNPQLPSNSSHKDKSIDKEKIAAVLWGNTMEYFDNLVYVHMLVIITPLFFPTNDPLALSILAATGFSINYLARPFGALLFGYIGDKVGRRISLYISITLMFLATGFIGVLPTYAQTGIYASAGLLILRFLQGLSCSGEASGALIYVMESVPKNKLYFYSALYNATITGGGVIAAFVITFSLSFLSAEDAWRYPFQVAAVVGCLGLLLRYNLAETEEFKKQKEKSKTLKLRQVLLERKNLINIFRVGSFSLFDAATFWVTYVFLTGLLSKHVGLDSKFVVIHNGAVMIFEIISGFIAARLALKFSGIKIALRAVYLILLSIIPLLLFIESVNYAYLAILLAQMIIIGCGNTFCVSTDPLRAYLFPVIGRFMGMAFGVSIGRVIGYVIGGYLLIAFNHLFGQIGGAIYLLIFTVPALIAVQTLAPESQAQLK